MVMPRALQGDDGFVKAGEAPLVLGNEDRLEAAVAVAGDLHPDRPFAGDHGFARGAVALIARGVGLGRAGRLT